MTKSVPPRRRRTKIMGMQTRPLLPPFARAALLAVGLGCVSACAHTGSRAPVGPAQAVSGEAAHIGRITYEDDFQEARLVLQALPEDARERPALRENLLRYLLDPVLALKPDELRREALELENDDTTDRVLDSFRDALGLFEPDELWAVPPRVSPAERARLEPAARLVL